MKKTTNIPLVRCFAFPHKNVFFKGWYFLSFSLLHTRAVRVLLILTLGRCLDFLVNVHINENGWVMGVNLSVKDSLFESGPIGQYLKKGVNTDQSYGGKVQIILS